MKIAAVPYEISDPVNARILAVSEDKLQGFQREPLQQIARQTGQRSLVAYAILGLAVSARGGKIADGAWLSLAIGLLQASQSSIGRKRG